MRKLSLDVEELAVESFQVAAAGEPRGTVAAHERTRSPDYTCWYHCTYAGETCFNQC